MPAARGEEGLFCACMKVLILGARGMLGQALVRVFSQHNSSQPPLTLRGGDPPLKIRGGKGGVMKEKGELLAWDRDDLDITNADAVREKIVALRPTLVINAAAYNDVDGAEKDATFANSINGDAVGYLAQAAASVGATFVHYSTDYVFDGTKREGYQEEDTPNPISAYGQSKILGEQQYLLSFRAIK